MTRDLPAHLVALMQEYARALDDIAPSPSLDARIEDLVATAPPGSRRGLWHRPSTWAAAAGFAAVAIGAGILIGVEIERSRDDAAEFTADSLTAFGLDPASLAMWPSDSVALTIPAEYSAEGTLVAVNPRTESSGKRYLIDVVVSNDGTIRIERIVPANEDVSQVIPDGHDMH